MLFFGTLAFANISFIVDAENISTEEVIIANEINNSINITADYECPEDDCGLLWTGNTKFCQGTKCKTKKEYECPCCDNIYWVYVD